MKPSKIWIPIAIAGLFSLASCGGGAKNETPTEGDTSAVRTDTSAEASFFPSRTEIKEDGVSPKKLTTGMVGEVKVSVQYGSPSVKGREVWGALVPYGEVWRSGANDASWVEFSQDVMINNQPLAAGKYGFFTIPAEGEWTVILNEVWDIWGAYDYDESRDVLRFNVEPQRADDNQESLEFEITNGNLVLKWEYLRLPIPVEPAVPS